MKLWYITTYKGKRILAPKKYDALTISQCVGIASQIPGARVDPEDGTVEGGAGALASVLSLAGEHETAAKLYGESLERAKLQKLGKRIYDALPAYQRWGAKFTLANLGSGVLNNDDIGLGKTVQTVAALSRLPTDHVKVIIGPAFLRRQWEEEIKRWVKVFRGDDPKTQVYLPKSLRRKKDVVVQDPEWVIGYYLDGGKLDEYIGHREYSLVIDEIHNVRGYDTKRQNEVRALSTFAAGRLGLTASPLYNDAAKLFPILDLAAPGEWGWYKPFVIRYASGVEGTFSVQTGKLSNVDELNKRRALHSFRRTKEEVADQLPFSVRYTAIWLDPPPDARDSIKGAALGGLAGQTDHFRRVSKHKIQSVLSQIDTDSKALVNSLTFTAWKEQAHDLARERPKSLLVTGDTHAAHKRTQAINSYVKRCREQGIAAEVIATMDSLTEGVNAQWAKVVNFGAFDYTPEKISQCIGRAARMGQEGEVLVRFFGCKHTIDEHFVAIILEKLGEQFRLDGKREKRKADLYEALSPRVVQDQLTAIYEKYLRMEKEGITP